MTTNSKGHEIEDKGANPTRTLKMILQNKNELWAS